jgi:hypothetical protein
MLSRSVRDFLAEDPQQLAETLAFQDMQHHRINEAMQLWAWLRSVALLQVALADWPAALDWRVVLEFSILRLGKRIDAVLVAPAGLVVLEFKVGSAAFDAAAKRQVEDYALDLQDFHAGSPRHPIVPVLVATDGRPAPPVWPLPLGFGVAGSVLEASAATLGTLLRDLMDRLPAPALPLDVVAWEHARYAPVPSIIDAACTLYDRHDVAEIAFASAEKKNLSETTGAILTAIREAKENSGKIIMFVTGVPGAGKTLCGLNAAFAVDRHDDATYLTGNPTLVHVMREALARDAARRGQVQIGKARQNMEKAVQALPLFRDHYVHTGDTPSEHVIVVDEAQRAWSGAYAVRKSVARAVKLTDSEAGHLLDAMARHADWAAVVCLIGGGQEIHDGEGGVAEWGRALAMRPEWSVLAAPEVTTVTDTRQRLPTLAGLRLDPLLHLDVPVRSIRNHFVADWVDAVLHGDATQAAAIAHEHGPMPFALTRDLAALRGCLRAAARGQRRAGLVASSGAKRLRADGMGAELPHMDAALVARWFLDHWPDVRASDALEVLGTEFSVQGLELDYVGLCWGGDLVRGPRGWQPWAFVGTNWQRVADPERHSNRLNTYRVLLTRARYRTVIWVPRGDAGDDTRRPQTFDAVAAFLERCGVGGLEAMVEPAPAREATLFG